MIAEEAHPTISEEQSPSNFVTGLLSKLAPQEVDEFESGGKGESNDAPTVVPEKNKKEGQAMNKPIKQSTIQINGDEVQVTSSSPKNQGKSSVLKPSFSDSSSYQDHTQVGI